MVPLVFQSFKVIVAEFTTESTAQLPGMSTFDVFIEHRFKMKYFVTIHTRQRRVFAVILHVLCDHLFRVKLPLTEVALEISVAVNFFVFREIAGVAKGFVAECALVEGQFGVFSEVGFVPVYLGEGFRLADLALYVEGSVLADRVLGQGAPDHMLDQMPFQVADSIERLVAHFTCLET